MDGLNKAIAIAGSQRALAEAIGLGQTAVANWIKRGGLVPVEHCAPIETAFSGAVTRKELRPDDWEIHWPELAVPATSPPIPRAIEALAAAPLTTDVALEADLEKAEQAGLVHLPKRAPIWNGAERRAALVQRRSVDREQADIDAAGPGAADV
ncbi:YdaS family helix-turn-helix protein [Polaromonas sp. OV174]|uniref:transcriptional regulator n=1 Tax=Polaromonas sp. OV174 TaxID=1855300 RepID=UPI000B86A61D|nr:YdaS family helix-turn-helix protein [Polaromonas sp. OV174]